MRLAQKVTVRDLMAIHRDVFEGTPFDQTNNPLAGPFGSPNRWTLARDYQPVEDYSPMERMVAVRQCREETPAGRDAAVVEILRRST